MRNDKVERTGLMAAVSVRERDDGVDRRVDRVDCGRVTEWYVEFDDAIVVSNDEG